MKSLFSEEIAASMQANLTSPEHMSVFAQSMADKCSACDHSPCECDKHSAKDSKDSSDSHSAKDSKDSSEDSHSAKDSSDSMVSEDSHSAKDSDSDTDSDDSYADDQVAIALDKAISGLLTASAALDNVGFEKSATLSLELAQFVVEAKKKAKKKSDSKKSKKKSDSKKSDKKSDSKKTDSKKSTKK